MTGVLPATHLKTLEQVRGDIDRQLRRLAQAYLYGTAAEQEQLKLRLHRLQAEEQQLTQRTERSVGAGR